MEAYDKIKKSLAVAFMNDLDNNRPEGKMYLSNGEFADIEKAFNEQDWPKLARYLDKYTESEDERIRKALIQFLTEIKNISEGGRDSWHVRKEDAGMCDSFLSYLEKQKEQNPSWSEDYQEEDIQTRFAFYTYKDAPSILYLSNVFVEEASRNHGFGTRILAAAEKVAETVGAITISLKVKQDSPANAWYRKNGYGYVAFEDGYDWLEKNLEYLKPAKSAEWSEEDEKFLELLHAALYQIKVRIGKDEYDRAVAWLKSLRPSW